MNYNIHPCEDRILIKRDEVEETTAFGIILPGSEKKQKSKGEVAAVGPGKFSEALGRRVKPEFAKGDKVMFNSYAGVDVGDSPEDGWED